LPADFGVLHHHQSIFFALHIPILNLYLLQAALDVASVDDHRPEFDDTQQTEHLSSYDLHVSGQILRIEEGIYDVRNE